MEITGYRHKGLKALAGCAQPTNVKGVPAEFARKLHQQLTFIQAAANVQQLATMQMWRVHPLEPKHHHRWAMWVSGNYRLTFRLDPMSNQITDVDLEDYH